ncbi:hypothetical protein F2Q68_00036199 [Brassica cretica]|uniref:Uncharacterized protein n=1 Tax=Brassica cretica TaxID=69181 RepID=A0A8S9H629_BRACR|nr:hypothetical protein F2Q68_00036199 [Brassica cretica]
MGTTACCHMESSPEPPHTKTLSSSSSPSNAAQGNRKPPCFELSFGRFSKLIITFKPLRILCMQSHHCVPLVETKP